MKSRLLFALAAPALLAGCGLNSVPTAEENVNARWADVQAQFQRRSNLIPNLVATVRAGAQSEGSILTNVINARARATQVNVTPEQLSDPAAVQNYANAQNQLNSSLSRLLVVTENYPQLQSQGGFRDLRVALEGTENRISVAINDYNTAVQAYNTRIRTFPDAIGAKIFYGARPRVPYQATAPGAENAPSVDFGNMN